ncbi:MAG TPA: helix-turn-helix domain-containing protein [Solirubrobacteraceae bacterium]|nr:helix-turn-helix domain-containing protein [Solirubrobacteraceae bacterium]
MIVDDLSMARAGRTDAKSSGARGSVRSRPDGPVAVELTNAQVESIIRATTEAQGPSLGLLLSGLIGERAISEGSLEDRYSAELESGRLSHSLFRGLLILALFISGGEGRGVVEVARQLGLSPSTTHRYMTTLVAFGLLVQDPATRKYRLPL